MIEGRTPRVLLNYMHATEPDPLDAAAEGVTAAQAAAQDARILAVRDANAKNDELKAATESELRLSIQSSLDARPCTAR